MADRHSDAEKGEPTLELPKLFGRKRRRSPAEEPSVERPVPPPAEAERSQATADDQTLLPTERPLFADEPPLRARRPDSADEPPPEERPTSSPDQPADTPTDTPAATEEPGARRAARTTPRLPHRLVAVLTGLLVGVTGTLLTYGALRGCETLTGTGSCGGGPGLLLLVAIFAVMVLLGGALLKAWGVADPRSTSFLAVGITAVVVMLTLLEAVFSVWMFLAVPLVTMAAYMVAHWVTTRFVEADSEQPDVEVR